jgi:7-cyano-7-deazaguanine synthase in queuosine biosynthesis
MHLTSEREVECIYPLVDVTKTEVMKMMPYELLKLCWYCRVPIDEKPCERCHTCKQVAEGTNEVIEENLKNYLRGF